MKDPRDFGIGRLTLIGSGTALLFAGAMFVWGSTFELAGAVIAPGSVVVESSVKKVQHQSGGIVRDILVAEGDEVEAGQVVLRFDDTIARATLGIVRSQLDELVAHETRLLAEREDADTLDFPPELLSRRQERTVDAAISGEEKLFESRRRSRLGQESQLRARISQSREEIVGLEAQQVSKEKELGLMKQELASVQDLFDKNLVSLARIMQLQRDQARLDGERGRLIAERARTLGRISEIELQILQLDRDFRTEVLKDLRESQGKIAELRERFATAKDQLERVEMRAPQAGFVHQLEVHTVGGVVAPGSTVMEIVPRADHLVVEAKAAPSEVDQVRVGGEAVVRIQAGNRRTTPEIEGVVTFVSPDALRDPPGSGQPAPYFLLRVSLPAAEIAKLGDLKLLPGMAAEVFVSTGERTMFQYLLAPLREQMARTFRER